MQDTSSQNNSSEKRDIKKDLLAAISELKDSNSDEDAYLLNFSEKKHEVNGLLFDYLISGEFYEDEYEFLKEFAEDIKSNKLKLFKVKELELDQKSEKYKKKLKNLKLENSQYGAEPFASWFLQNYLEDDKQIDKLDEKMLSTAYGVFKEEYLKTKEQAEEERILERIEIYDALLFELVVFLERMQKALRQNEDFVYLHVGKRIASLLTTGDYQKYSFKPIAYLLKFWELEYKTLVRYKDNTTHESVKYELDEALRELINDKDGFHPIHTGEKKNFLSACLFFWEENMK